MRRGLVSLFLQPSPLMQLCFGAALLVLKSPGQSQSLLIALIL